MKRKFILAAMFSAALLMGYTSCSKDDDKKDEPVNQEQTQTTNYTIKFDSNGGSAVADVTAKSGDAVTLPTAPTKEGYTFKGWSEVKDGAILTSYTASKDATLYAVWIEQGQDPTPTPEPEPTPTPTPAGGEVDLTADGFSTWSDWVNGTSTGAADCAYVIGESTGQPYGDPNVNNYIDLSEYKTLVVVASEGAPRFLLNRDEAEGQDPDHLINIPNNADQTAAYQTSTENGDGTTTFTIDLAKIVADKGYAHLHAIKGASWQNVTVVSMKLTK